MDFSLSSSLVGSAVLSADKLALDLQFATDKTLTARKGPTPVFARGSTGRFVGSNKLIQSAAINEPRFDHDPVTGVCKGLLIEEQRMNMAWHSGAIVANAGWLLSQVTSVVDGTSIDGGAAYLITEDPVTNTHSVANTGGATGTAATSVVSGTTYTGSIFVKKSPSSVDWVQLTFGSVGFGAAQYANFNLSTGAVGNFAGCTTRMEQFSNGWYRCSISAAAIATTTTSVGLAIFLTNNTNPTTRALSYAGNAANKILASMCQFEAGSFFTSYIPTGGSSIIRSADVCSISGSDFNGFWNLLEGSLSTSAIFNAPAANATTQFLVDVNDGATANRLRYYRLLTTGRPEFANTSGNSLNAQIIGSTALQPFVTQKYSAGFKLDDYAFYVNNTQIGTDNLGAMIVSPTTMTIGDASAGAARFYTNGTISSIRYYKKRLSNAKLQAITV